jgi:DNA-binding NarL/FixJ family response regulator
VAEKRRILIIDDHPLFREGIKTIIARHNRFEVVDEAGTGREGLKRPAGSSPMSSCWTFPCPMNRHGSGPQNPSPPAAHAHHDPEHAFQDRLYRGSFQSGATGYVVKESAAERLAQALDAVASGEYFLDSSISHEVVAKLMQSPVKEAKVSDAGYGKLTAREQEIMRMLAEGASKGQIADQLCISIKTVENHRANIMRKLDIHSAMELVRYAARLGLIDVDLWKE